MLLPLRSKDTIFLFCTNKSHQLLNVFENYTTFLVWSATLTAICLKITADKNYIATNKEKSTNKNIVFVLL